MAGSKVRSKSEITSTREIKGEVKKGGIEDKVLN